MWIAMLADFKIARPNNVQAARKQNGQQESSEDTEGATSLMCSQYVCICFSLYLGMNSIK